MATSTAPKAFISAGSVAKEVRAKLQALSSFSAAKQQNATSVLKKTTESVDTETSTQVLETAKQTQKTALKKALAQETITIKDKPIRRTREERTYDRVMNSLNLYKISAVGSMDRIVAIQRAMEGSLKQPKKHLLDSVLNFFKENKNEASFQETQALQRIASLSPTSRLQLEIWFRIFMMLATKTASKKTLSLNQVRSIFKNEDFLNWVAVTMSRR